MIFFGSIVCIRPAKFNLSKICVRLSTKVAKTLAGFSQDLDKEYCAYFLDVTVLDGSLDDFCELVKFGYCEAR